MFPAIPSCHDLLLAFPTAAVAFLAGLFNSFMRHSWHVSDYSGVSQSLPAALIHLLQYSTTISHLFINIIIHFQHFPDHFQQFPAIWLCFQPFSAVTSYCQFISSSGLHCVFYPFCCYSPTGSLGQPCAFKTIFNTPIHPSRCSSCTQAATKIPQIVAWPASDLNTPRPWDCPNQPMASIHSHIHHNQSGSSLHLFSPPPSPSHIIYMSFF